MKITGLTVIKDSKTWENGDKLIAKFDVEYAGLEIRECQLIRVRRGFLLAQMPRGVSHGEGKRLFKILDPEIRKAMSVAAHNIYVALGGVEDRAA